MYVQVPDVSGIQQPARNATRQLPKSGLVGSEQVGAPPAPLELVDEEDDVDEDEDEDDEVEEEVDEDEDEEDEPCPPDPSVVLDDVPAPAPVEPVGEPHAAHAAAIAANGIHERDIGASSMKDAVTQASGEPRRIEGRLASPTASCRTLDA